MENEDVINQTAEILSCNRQQTNLKFFYHVSLGPAVSEHFGKYVNVNFLGIYEGPKDLEHLTLFCQFVVWQCGGSAHEFSTAQ